jgi:phosphoglycolate phosphatase-like HAD superfamily hydrolase
MTAKPEAVIFDCDGTLVDVTSIRHHVLTKPKNFDAFHYGSIFCPANGWVVEELDGHRRDGKAIIVVTARERRWGTLTENWLADHAVEYHELHMRPTGDFRADTLIKGEILALLQERYEIRHAYDDNPAIIDLWTGHGIPTTIVPGWAEERV